MTRIRLNQEYRNKIAKRFRVHTEQEPTLEKEKYEIAKSNIIFKTDDAWELAKKIVRRTYTEEDVEKAYYLQNKFENVDTIAKDSCFHFYYEEPSPFKPKSETQIKKHFNFKLNANLNGEDNYQTNEEFGYALYRDEINAKENTNADCEIENPNGNQHPQLITFRNNNNAVLGFSSSKEGEISYQKQWDNKYSLDIIGRQYCRDRSIPCTKQEFEELVEWQVHKQKLIQFHHEWISSVLKQVKVFKEAIKQYKYLDEAIDLASKCGLNISEAELIRVNTTGLVMYEPTVVADLINSMKNKKAPTREEKIKARLLYEKGQANANS